MLLAHDLRSSWCSAVSARRAPQMEVPKGRTLWGTGQGQRRKDGLSIYFWGILLCSGVKKGSKEGEVRSGRCHVSVGGSTGFKSTSELGFNTNYPTIVSAWAPIVLIVLTTPNLAFMERTVHTMERGMLMKQGHFPEWFRSFKGAGVLARCITPSWTPSPGSHIPPTCMQVWASFLQVFVAYPISSPLMCFLILPAFCPPELEIPILALTSPESQLGMEQT